ncbi:MAG: WXG100 family type VII secretion target [Deltaproteobacteria bacterium]|jgi:WXG100 family type VII secretion target|nr:WXG100 family type VII secretion target [Deltaproteobacteria bacterium]
MADEIKVDPKQLRAFAEDISKCQASYRTSLANSKSQVDSLKNVWTGEAAGAFNSSFQQLYAKCGEGVDSLSRMVKALFESADAYERTEKSVQNEASKIPKLPNNMMR